jgi:hypothetical protein
MSNANKMKRKIVNSKQKYISQDRTSPNAKCQRLQEMAGRHNEHNVTASFFVELIWMTACLVDFSCEESKGHNEFWNVVRNVVSACFLDCFQTEKYFFIPTPISD